jgi:hypothetical protein
LAFVYKKYNLNDRPTRKTTEIGLDELRMLMDVNISSPNIEMWEQHHLAWELFMKRAFTCIEDIRELWTEEIGRIATPQQVPAAPGRQGVC